MAVIKVVDVLDQAAYMLTDESAVRWPKETLLEWFNEAQRAVVLRRPDSLAVNEPFSCAAGAKQILPAVGIRLIDIIRVIGGSGITKVDKSQLDAHVRDWYTHAETAALEHFVYDERDPKTFYLYPPAIATTSIEIVYSKSPDVIVIADFVNDTQVISVDDVFANALQEYILYKAWMKDAEHAGNQDRANGHFNQFRVAIGEKTQADAMMAPTTNG